MLKGEPVIDSLKEFVHREEFRPIRIFTNGGQHYDITHPDNLALGKSELFYYLPKSDRSVRIAYHNIASVEEMSGKAVK
jgi:hypothetical protein